MKPCHPAQTLTRRSWVAVFVAVALLGVSGVGYRLTAARLGDLSGTVALARGTLRQLPLQIGDWAGREVPLGPRIVEATDTDDHVNRVYVRNSGTEQVALLIAYGVRMRDLMPHRPEVCYPGNGWTLESQRTLELTAGDGTVLPCQVHRFSRGGMTARRTTVLSYYVVDGRYCPDVSLLRSKGWRSGTDMRYAAQIQVSSGDDFLRRAAADTVRKFAADTAPVIRDLLQRVVDEAAAELEAPER